MKVIYKIVMYMLFIAAAGEIQPTSQRRWTPAEAERRAKTGKFDSSDKDQLLADLPTEWKKHHRSIVRDIQGSSRSKDGETKESPRERERVIEEAPVVEKTEPQKFIKEEELFFKDEFVKEETTVVDCKGSQDIDIMLLGLLQSLSLEKLQGEIDDFDSSLQDILKTGQPARLLYRFFLMDVYLYNQANNLENEYKGQTDGAVVNSAYNKIFTSLQKLMTDIYCKINTKEVLATNKIKEWEESALAVINNTEKFLKDDKQRWDGADKGKSHQATMNSLKKLFS